LEAEEPSTEADRDTVSRALLKAAELVGGLTPLQHYLHVDRSELFRCIVGNGTPPDPIFLRVVDILVDPQAAQFAVIEHKKLRDEAGLSNEKPE